MRFCSLKRRQYCDSARKLNILIVFVCLRPAFRYEPLTGSHIHSSRHSTWTWWIAQSHLKQEVWRQMCFTHAHNKVMARKHRKLGQIVSLLSCNICNFIYNMKALNHKLGKKTSQRWNIFSLPSCVYFIKKNPFYFSSIFFKVFFLPFPFFFIILNMKKWCWKKWI